MASEFRNFSDFPKRAIPLCGWPEYARVMTQYSTKYLYAEFLGKVVGIVFVTKLISLTFVGKSIDSDFEKD